MKKAIGLSALFLILAGCGYQEGGGGLLLDRYNTMTIPYAKGDLDGDLTACIVEAISASGCFEYRKEGGALELLVAVDDVDEENIDFRYDRHKDGRIKHSIIPSETRMTSIVQVSVVEAGSGTVVLGPVKISASVEFDHDYYKSRNGVNVFSLGQLTDYDAAHDAAEHPLNQALAKKIADFVCDSW